MSSAEPSLIRRALRRLAQPQLIFFGICLIPVAIMSVQMKPANQEDMIKDFRKRYGYQYEQDSKIRNAKVMETIWANRHAPVSDYTPTYKPAAAAAADADKKPASA